MEFELRKRKISLNSIRLISSLHRPYEKQIFEFNELAGVLQHCFFFFHLSFLMHSASMAAKIEFGNNNFLDHEIFSEE
jgi:hypothetical protein